MSWKFMPLVENEQIVFALLNIGWLSLLKTAWFGTVEVQIILASYDITADQLFCWVSSTCLSFYWNEICCLIIWTVRDSVVSVCMCVLIHLHESVLDALKSNLLPNISLHVAGIMYRYYIQCGLMTVSVYCLEAGINTQGPDFQKNLMIILEFS